MAYEDDWRLAQASPGAQDQPAQPGMLQQFRNDWNERVSTPLQGMRDNFQNAAAGPVNQLRTFFQAPPAPEPEAVAPMMSPDEKAAFLSTAPATPQAAPMALAKNPPGSLAPPLPNQGLAGSYAAAQPRPPAPMMGLAGPMMFPRFKPWGT